MKRVFLIVLDSLGIGEAPDAAAFGDVGANTLRRIAASPYFCADTLQALGLGNIDCVTCTSPVSAHRASAARLRQDRFLAGRGRSA